MKKCELTKKYIGLMTIVAFTIFYVAGLMETNKSIFSNTIPLFVIANQYCAMFLIYKVEHMLSLLVFPLGLSVRFYA